MKESRLVIGLTALASALFAGDVSGSPLLGGRGGGGTVIEDGPGLGRLLPTLLRALDLTAEQRNRLAAIMARHRANLEPMFKQLRAAHDDLASKVFAPGTVTAADLAPAIERIGGLKQRLLREWTQTALETRAVLTPEQLAKAAQVKQRLDALPAEIDDLLGRLPVPPGGHRD